MMRDRMKDKKIPILIVLLAFVAMITIGVKKLGDSNQTSLIGTSLISIDDMVKVDQIRLQKGESVVHLEKNKSDLWVVKGQEEFPASGEKVVNFLEQLNLTRYQGKASSRKEKWSQLGLKDDKVELKVGDKNRTFFLGKPREGGGQYIAKQGSVDSWLVDKEIDLDIKPELWELDVLVDVAGEKAQSVALFPKNPKSKSVIFSRKNKEEELVMEGILGEEKSNRAAVKELENILTRLVYKEKVKSHTNEKIVNSLKHVSDFKMETFDGDKYMISVRSHGAKDPEYFLTVELNGSKDAAKEQFYKNLNGVWLFKFDSEQALKFARGRSEFLEKNVKN